MEKKFIDNVLKVMKFNIQYKEKELISFVNMTNYKVATKDKPLLLTINLQSCIALYAYTNNFSYLAHMNMYKGNWQDDFEINESIVNSKCKKIDNLFCEIIKHKKGINEPVYIGLVLGISPLSEDYVSRVVLEKNLKSLIEHLNEVGISTIRNQDINSFNFILDSRYGIIIQDGIKNNGEIVDIKNYGYLDKRK